jgi:hypothetical protein
MFRRLFVRAAALAACLPALCFATPAHAGSAGLWRWFVNIIAPGLGTW